MAEHADGCKHLISSRSTPCTSTVNCNPSLPLLTSLAVAIFAWPGSCTAENYETVQDAWESRNSKYSTLDIAVSMSEHVASREAYDESELLRGDSRGVERAVGRVWHKLLDNGSEARGMEYRVLFDGTRMHATSHQPVFNYSTGQTRFVDREEAVGDGTLRILNRIQGEAKPLQGVIASGSALSIQTLADFNPLFFLIQPESVIPADLISSVSDVNDDGHLVLTAKNGRIWEVDPHMQYSVVRTFLQTPGGSTSEMVVSYSFDQDHAIWAPTAWTSTSIRDKRVKRLHARVVDCVFNREILPHEFDVVFQAGTLVRTETDSGRGRFYRVGANGEELAPHEQSRSDGWWGPTVFWVSLVGLVVTIVSVVLRHRRSESR